MTRYRRPARDKVDGRGGLRSGEQGSGNAKTRSSNVHSTGVVVFEPLEARRLLSAPVIGSLIANPDPVAHLGMLTLEALDVSENGGAPIRTIEFWRDVNDDGVITYGVDHFLGRDVDGTDSWSIETIAHELWADPWGQVDYLVRAQNTDYEWSNIVSHTGSIYAGPWIDSLTTSPEPVAHLATLSMKANGVTDSEGLAINLVEFWRDVDGDGMITYGVDHFLGRDTDGTDGWSIETPAHILWADENGDVTYMTRARNTDYQWSWIVLSDGQIFIAPTIDSLNISANPINEGDSFTLSANGLRHGTGGEITALEIWLDTNADGVIDETTDMLLATDTDGSDGWSITQTADRAWADTNTGAMTFAARVIDSVGLVSNTVSASTRLNTAPIISDLIVSASTVFDGDAFTISAVNVSDDFGGQVSVVGFWRDVDGDGTLNKSIDELVGTSTDPAPGYDLPLTADLDWADDRGMVSFFAQAVDDDGSMSAVVSTSIKIIPQVGWTLVVISGDTVVDHQKFTVEFQGLGMDTSHIKRVRFWVDRNGDGRVNARHDKNLGQDRDGSNGWTVNARANWRWGDDDETVQLLARVKTWGKKWSETISTTMQVIPDERPPAHSRGRRYEKHNTADQPDGVEEFLEQVLGLRGRNNGRGKS